MVSIGMYFPPTYLYPDNKNPSISAQHVLLRGLEIELSEEKSGHSVNATSVGGWISD